MSKKITSGFPKNTPADIAFHKAKKAAEAKKAESTSESVVKELAVAEEASKPEAKVDAPSVPAKPVETIEPAASIVEKEEAPVLDTPESTATINTTTTGSDEGKESKAEEVEVEDNVEVEYTFPEFIAFLKEMDEEGVDVDAVLNKASLEMYEVSSNQLTEKQMQDSDFIKIAKNHAKNAWNELEQKDIELVEVVEPEVDSTPLDLDNAADKAMSAINDINSDF